MIIGTLFSSVPALHIPKKYLAVSKAVPLVLLILIPLALMPKDCLIPLTSA